MMASPLTSLALESECSGSVLPYLWLQTWTGAGTKHHTLDGTDWRSGCGHLWDCSAFFFCQRSVSTTCLDFIVLVLDHCEPSCCELSHCELSQVKCLMVGKSNTDGIINKLCKGGDYGLFE